MKFHTPGDDRTMDRLNEAMEMTDESIKRAVRTEQRSRAVRDAGALRLVGAAVAVAAKAQKKGFFNPVYEVPKAEMERLIEAVRDSGFKV